MIDVYNLILRGQKIILLYNYALLSSQVYFTNVQNKSRHRWETAKDLTTIKSATSSINNLKRFTLRGISLEVKIIKKKKQKRI